MTNNKFTLIVLKAFLFLATVYFIYTRLIHNPSISDINVLTSPRVAIGLMIVILLSFVNWGIESLKWQLLVRSIYHITFSQAVASVLAGVSLGLFTPNRIGESIGRTLPLEKDKDKIIILSSVGALSQFTVTLMLGVCSLIYLVYFGLIKISINYSYLSFTALIVLVVGLAFWKGKILLNNLLKAVKDRYLKILVQTMLLGWKRLGIVNALSLIRYFVFTSQILILLYCLQVNVSPTIMFVLVAVNFLMSSAIPVLPFLDLAVKTSILVLLFEPYTTNTAGVMTSSVLIWIINLAIPAFVGSSVLFFQKRSAL